MPDGLTALGRWHAPGFQHGRLLCEKGRFRPAFLCGLLIVNTLQLVGCAAVPEPPRQPDNACAILAEKPQWDRAMRTVKRRWGVPVEVQLAIIRNESSFRHDARPRSPSGGYASSAYGYPQAIDGTWEWYRDETGKRRAKRTDFADAADFIGWYTDRSRRVLGISQGDAYNQYLAYHEGHSGFQRGSYRRKLWLQRYARQVDRHARAYAKQLSRCRARS